MTTTSPAMAPVQAYAKALSLRGKCEHAFDEDPNTEVGKVIGTPDESFFFVYVMTGDAGFRSRKIARTNIVIASARGVEIHGPDEEAIAMILGGGAR